MGVICKYKFDSSIYADLIPTFTGDYANYTIKDEVEGNIVTRTMESDTLPTALRLGTTQSVGNREHSLLEVLYINTSKLLYLEAMFRGCMNLTKVNIDWKECKPITNINYMFSGCSSLTSLDLSDFDISNTTSSNYMFNNTPLLTDIGMLNCNSNTIQGIINSIPTSLSKTVWYKNTDVSNITIPSHVELREYKEDIIEIKLNSPLLEEDTIEVVDGKLCHVHRWDSMILDGNSNWVYFTTNFPTVYAHIDFKKVYADNSKQCVFCENILSEKGSRWSDNSKEMIYIWKWEDKQHENSIYLQIYSKRLPTEDFDGFKQYLSQNPLTIIYKLAEPYYEDITPLQSSIVLKTFLESYMTIDTNLPIETKLSYRTNVPSISTLSTRATELAESDNVIHNLMNIIDDEVDE